MTDLPPFNPDADHVAAKPIRFAGRALLKGQAIDPTQIPEGDRTRKMQMLYEQRLIVPLRSDGEDDGEDDLTDVERTRIAALVDSNSRNALDGYAKGIEGADKLTTKGDIATAIVRAERDGTLRAPVTLGSQASEETGGEEAPAA